MHLARQPAAVEVWGPIQFGPGSPYILQHRVNPKLDPCQKLNLLNQTLNWTGCYKWTTHVT